MNHGGGGGGGSDDGGNSTVIDDLDDNILTQIFFRLSSYAPPPCAPLVACKLVNKRWCSLISNPKFAYHFSNHKKEISILSESAPNIEDDEPPWTFIASRRDQYTNWPVWPFCQYIVRNTSPIESVPEISCVLDQIYYITNPLTKQWAALPPCPGIFRSGWNKWAGLVCQQPYDYTQDYKFRVVLIYQSTTPVYRLPVYCSETGWKKFNLIVPIKRELVTQNLFYNFRFSAVICNGIIYLHQKLYLAAFNPFDVDETTDTTTIEAKLLPSLPDPVDGYLRESSGQLFVMHNPDKECRTMMSYKKHGSTIEFPLKVWKLDPNQVPLIWKTTFEGSCTSNLNKCKESLFDYSFTSVSNLGMHPNNDKLIYPHLLQEELLVLCDTGTRLIKC